MILGIKFSMKSIVTNKASLLSGTRRILDSQTPQLLLFAALIIISMIVAGVVPVILLSSFLLAYILIVAAQKQNKMQVSLALILILASLLFSSFFDQNLWFTFWIFLSLNFLYFVHAAKQKHDQKRLIQSIQDSNLILFFIFFIVLFSKIINPIDLWAWQFRGDGINFIVSTRAISSTKTLFEGTFLNSSITGITPGFTFLFQFISQGLINLTSSDNRSLVIVGEAFVGVQILTLGALGMSLLSLRRNVNFAAKSLALVAMNFFVLGPLVGGLTLSNGFLSIPIAMTLMVLILQSIREFSGGGYRFSYFSIQATLLVLLASVWSLIAILAGSLLALSIFLEFTSRLNPLVRHRSRDNRPSSRLAVPLIFSLSAYLVFQSIFNLSYVKENIVRSGGFPQIPLSQYLLFAIFLVLIVSVTGSKKGLRKTSYFGVSSMFFAAIFQVHETTLGSDKILSDLTSNWVTSIYYLQKAFWIFVGSLLLFLLVTSAKNGILVSGIYLLFALSPFQPIALWNLEARSMTPYEGIERVLSQPEGKRVMYFEFGTWPGDAYLNSLSGLQFESYTGHDLGGRFYKSSFYMPQDSFTSRSYYTTEQNALCVGQSLIGTNGVIYTSNPLLGEKLISLCGRGPFPQVVVNGE
jgi:hypothetical protein